MHAKNHSAPHAHLNLPWELIGSLINQILPYMVILAIWQLIRVLLSSKCNPWVVCDAGHVCTCSGSVHAKFEHKIRLSTPFWFSAQAPRLAWCGQVACACHHACANLVLVPIMGVKPGKFEARRACLACHRKCGQSVVPWAQLKFFHLC